MKKIVCLLAFMAFSSIQNGFAQAASVNTEAPDPSAPKVVPMNNFYGFTVTDIEGNEFDFASLKGKKVMVINTASNCGFTPQYKELEELYLKYKSQNFVIIGFPSNDFGKQEPGSDKEIKTFCQKNYGVTFPMMSKISVKDKEKAPIYQFLTEKKNNGINNFDVRWNFQKFLIDENGKIVKMLESKVTPLDKEITSWIETPAPPSQVKSKK